MTGPFRIFSLPGVAAALAALGLTASPIAAAQALRPPPTADAQTQQSFLATPEFKRLVEGKSIVVITTRGLVYEGHFTVSGNTLVSRGHGTAVLVPFEEVSQIQKSNFRIRTHTLIGLGVGATVGLLLANDTCGGNCGTWWFYFGALGGGAGAGIGALNGAKLNARDARDAQNARYADADILYARGQPFATRLVSSALVRLIKGKDVWVTTTDGATRRGEIVAVNENGLILTGPLGESLSLDQIVTIVEVSHRLRNGVVSGLAAGASIGLVRYLGCQEGAGSGSGCGDKFLRYTAVGVGTGVLVAALMNWDKDYDLLFDSGRKARTVSFAPILSPKRKGVAFRMTWR